MSSESPAVFGDSHAFNDSAAFDDNTVAPAGTGADLVREALESARKNQAVPAAPGRDSRRRAANRRANRRGGYSGSGPDERDPRRAADVLSGLLTERGWGEHLAQARIFGDWASIVGNEIASHCQPVSLRDGELRLQAQSTAWATQLRLMSSQILRHLNNELGSKLVVRLHISGPVGPSWKHGAWSVRGHRGPRDTYG